MKPRGTPWRRLARCGRPSVKAGRTLPIESGKLFFRNGHPDPADMSSATTTVPHSVNLPSSVTNPSERPSPKSGRLGGGLISGGPEGLQLIRTLEAATQSLFLKGQPIPL